MTTAYPTTEQRVFKRLALDVQGAVAAENRVLVEWALEPTAVGRIPGPYTFTLERGYAATDDGFTPVAITVDQPWAYDNNPIFPQKGNTDVFYRVVLTDGEGVTYTSQAQAVGVYWGRYDFSLAREIIRKETLLLRKRAGVQGWLLKRRIFGAACECVNPNTGQIENPNCPSCYGTGIDGGFYEPFEYWVLMNPSQRMKKLDGDQGLLTETIETVRALAYPRPAANDIWVHHHTDQRFVIQGDISAIARHRGIDLVLNLRLQERGRSEPIYQVPVPCG